jgi:PAS domain S-box-containing protein
LAAILDHLPDALLLIDPAGAVVNANARAIEAFGAGGAAALVGRTLAELLPGLTPDLAGSPSTWPADGTPPSRTYAHALTGSSFGVEVACSRVPWGGGEERLLVSLREGESAVEAELVRTGRAAQAVLRSTEEAVCGVDRDGRVMLANPAAARLLGARVSAIAGRDLHALAMHTRVDGTPYPAAEAPVARTLRTGRRLRRRPEIVWRQDGSPVPVEVSTAPIKDGNEVIGAVLSFSDMTESAELERRRARLIEVLAAELTPALAKLTVEAEQEDLVTRLRGIVADAIDYEHLMTGQAVPELTAADLQDVVNDAVAIRQEAAAERSVELQVETVPAPAAADPQRLTVAVAELIRAAVAAAPAGGTVTVTVGAEPDLLRIAVDGAEQAGGTGENPLLRWLRPRGSVPAGADPDLALVQIVAEAHGGRFLLESKPDGVRSYVLELPPVIESTPGPRKHARNSIPHPEPTLVVVPEQAPVATPAHAAAPEPAGAPEPVAAIPAQSGATGAAEEAAASTSELAVVSTDDVPADETEAGQTGQSAGATSDTVGAAQPQVLVWPEPTPQLSDVLTARGLASVALSRPEQPAIVPVGTAVVLIDPGAGPLRRKRLAELGAAVAEAALPLLAVVGLAELDSPDPASDPTVLLNCLVPSGQAGRVLIIEDDPALAAAFGAGLALAGVRGWHARSDAEAAGRLAHARPDVVLRNLDGPEPADDRWLRPIDGPPVPVLGYTTDELSEGHQLRLERGQTVLGLAPRLQSAVTDQRLAAVLARLSGGKA